MTRAPRPSLADRSDEIWLETERDWLHWRDVRRLAAEYGIPPRQLRKLYAAFVALIERETNLCTELQTRAWLVEEAEGFTEFQIFHAERELLARTTCRANGLGGSTDMQAHKRGYRR